MPQHAVPSFSLSVGLWRESGISRFSVMSLADTLGHLKGSLTAERPQTHSNDDDAQTEGRHHDAAFHRYTSPQTTWLWGQNTQRTAQKGLRACALQSCATTDDISTLRDFTYVESCDKYSVSSGFGCLIFANISHVAECTCSSPFALLCRTPPGAQSTHFSPCVWVISSWKLRRTKL